MRMLAVAAAAIFLSACANTIESRTAAGGGVGLSYMAPMRLLTITATRAPPTSGAVVNTARTALVRAEVEFAAATDALATATSEVTLARRLATAGPDIAAWQDDLVEKVATQTAAQTRLDTATTAVARARTAYENAVRGAAPASPLSEPLRETLEVTMGPAVGDRNARFVANISNNWFRSARGRIVVGQNGLLQSANLTVDGQIDEVLVGVAQSLVAIRSSGGTSPPSLPEVRTIPVCTANGDIGQGSVGDPNAPPPSATATTLSIAFNPVSQTDINLVNHALCMDGFSYRVRVRDGRPVTLPVLPPATERRPATTATSLTPQFTAMCSLTVGYGNAAPRRCPGLVYRQNEPMNIDIYRYRYENGSARTFIERSFSFSVPNAAPVDVLRYDDAAFVTRRDDVGFVDGSLVSLDFDHPSEAAVAASVPFRIVRGTTEALSELVQLRLNLTNQRAALTAAEQAEANAAAAGPASAEIAQLESAQRLLELRLQVEEARQRLLEAEARAAGGGD